MKPNPKGKTPLKKADMTFRKEGNEYIVSISKDIISREALLNLLQKLELASLSRKIKLKKGAQTAFENIQSEWWKSNKERFLSRGK